MVKRDYLVAELGLETVELMRRIKVHLPATKADKLARVGPTRTPQSRYLLLTNTSNISEKVIPVLHWKSPVNPTLKKGGMTTVHL